LFRREWRRQALVLGLLATVVSAAFVSAAAAYNTVGPPENATFGLANHRFVVSDPDPAALAAALAAARERFGPVDVVGIWQRPVLGTRRRTATGTGYGHGRDRGTGVGRDRSWCGPGCGPGCVISAS
jgi:hypothetical protein